ncbi:carbohydrate-binding module family 18 protein [Piromyces sp. E2]|nr:carbohydrate-binding module family 18 protein [Piromyces sp. E2]|eukprot:OUM65065.1 carbohydrate-binding module family 18 protein [Piromyces sp. E2]
MCNFSKYDICKDSETVNCLNKEQQDQYKVCSNGNMNEEEEQPSDIKISTDGRCGKGLGKCPNGQCCSKYGWCGTSALHCIFLVIPNTVNVKMLMMLLLPLVIVVHLMANVKVIVAVCMAGVVKVINSVDLDVKVNLVDVTKRI